jgi:hypothetical protein
VKLLIIIDKTILNRREVRKAETRQRRENERNRIKILNEAIKRNKKELLDRHIDISSIKTIRQLKYLLSGSSRRIIPENIKNNNTGNWIVIVEYSYIYESDDTIRAEHSFYVPIQIHSKKKPNKSQIKKAIRDHLENGNGNYTVGEISDVHVLSYHSPRDIRMRGEAIGLWSENKTDIKQRKGHCVLDWVMTVIKFNCMSRTTFEKRFYDFIKNIEGSNIEGVTTKEALLYITEHLKNISVMILDGTGGIIDKLIATERHDHQWLVGVCTNGHLSPITGNNGIMNRNTSQATIDKILGLTKISNNDLRNAIYVEKSTIKIKVDGKETSKDIIDFEIGSEDVPVITNLSITNSIKNFQEEYPNYIISAISIDKKCMLNPVTGGLIISMADYQDRLETHCLI